MKVFDLSSNYKFIGKDVQKNLSKLHKTFGKRFDIKYRTLKVPVILYKRKFEYNKRISYYILEYFISRNTENPLPFSIDFFDSNKQEKKNSTYISNIHKTDKISGSQMVELVLEIQKKLNVKKTYLYDGAEIDCKDKKIDLSFFKLIEKNRTFYQKFGFYFSLPNWELLKTMFNDKENMKKVLDKNINLFKKIKINEYIEKYRKLVDLIANVIKKQDYNKIDIIYTDGIWSNNVLYEKKDKIENILSEMLGNSNNLLKIFLKTKKIYLYQLLIELLGNLECFEYENIFNDIINNTAHKVVYKNKQIIFNHIEIFQILLLIRGNSKFEYVFK